MNRPILGFTLAMLVTMMASTTPAIAAKPTDGGGNGSGKTTLTDLGCVDGEAARVNAVGDWECSTSLTDNEGNISTAQSTADSAQTAAAAAQSTAGGAQTAASAAQSTADGAQATATTAQGTANTAQAKADSALGTISSILLTAEAALELSIEASQNASQADSKADIALFDAYYAKDGAQVNYDMLVNNIEPRLNDLEASMYGMIFEDFVRYGACFDLESGSEEVPTSTTKGCLPEEDIYFDYSDGGPESPTLLWNMQYVDIALIPGAPFHAVTPLILERTIRFATHISEFPDQNFNVPFTSSDTALVRTGDGNLYKVGFAICTTQEPGIYPKCMAVTGNIHEGVQFQYQLLQEAATVWLDVDGDTYTTEVDCDDSNPTVYPGAPELPDGLDNDCDSLIDET